MWWAFFWPQQSVRAIFLPKINWVYLPDDSNSKSLLKPFLKLKQNLPRPLSLFRSARATPSESRSMQILTLKSMPLHLKFCKIMLGPESGCLTQATSVPVHELGSALTSALISTADLYDTRCYPGVHEQHQHNGCQWIAISADFSTDLRWPVWYKLLPRSARATSVAANESRSALTSTSESNVRSTRAASVAASSDSFAVKFWPIPLVSANLLT